MSQWWIKGKPMIEVGFYDPNLKKSYPLNWWGWFCNRIDWMGVSPSGTFILLTLYILKLILL